MRILLFITLYFLHTQLLAQTQKRYIVKAGETPSAVLPNEAIYVLPVFTAGTVLLRDGSFSKQELNYNYVLDEMQFLGTNNDTLTIADPAITRNIVIDSLVFYYDKFYLREIFKTDSFKLAVKQMLVMTSDKEYGGYDMAMGSSSTNSYGSINSNSSMYRLQVKKDVYFEKRYAYYLGGQFNQFVKADKKHFYNFFSNKKALLQKYLKENNINYNMIEDIKKLLKFCVEN